MLGLHSSLLMEHLKTIKAGVRRSRGGFWWSPGLSYHDLLSGMKNAYKEKER